ncbi:hypothetical protein [Oceanicoccus sp. KOV_DT_Chl]|uniref:hypothetical protein n=1 Tax=Oceanicoccus sp. KOV_DT_Chl TaxID=1904639 RepID=UPI00135BDDD6|nr:hypothetical protein [Oceanicoccus sp. KOV_DT_Chl]
MLDAYVEVAKTRVAGPVPMCDDPGAKKVAARAKSEIEHMKLIMYSNFDHMLDAASKGEAVPMVDRARYRYDASMVADQCLELSSLMLKAGGSGGIRLGSEMLDRHLDIFASQAHIANISEPFAVNLGGILFGQEPSDPSL